MAYDRIFGWDLPPGCSTHDLPGYKEEPCDVCGLPVDNCICPECSECGAVGDPSCYVLHGLIVSDAQLHSKAKYDEYCQKELEALIEFEKTYFENYPDNNEY